MGASLFWGAISASLLIGAVLGVMRPWTAKARARPGIRGGGSHLGHLVPAGRRRVRGGGSLAADHRAGRGRTRLLLRRPGRGAVGDQGRWDGRAAAGPRWPARRDPGAGGSRHRPVARERRLARAAHGDLRVEPAGVDRLLDPDARGRESTRYVLLLWVAVALVCVVSTWAGYLAAAVTKGRFEGLVDGFAAGALLVMLVGAMIPEAQKNAGRAAGLAAVLGFAVASGWPSRPEVWLLPHAWDWCGEASRPCG
jgi:ZIP family zinc transporter